jgi:FtsP/CotA-like multicopper oxidase with cupredoxin domain
MRIFRLAFVLFTYVNVALAEQQNATPPELDPCAPYPALEGNGQDLAEHLQKLMDKYAKDTAFQNPPVVRPTTPQTAYTLVVKYTKDKELAGCPVTLRSYNGELVGATIRAKPGDTLYIKLINDLPRDPLVNHPQNPHPPAHGDFFSFNITNLHTHGLHTSPSGNSDNVFLAVQPSQTQEYEIHIHDRHPAGTFWYHAHYHGATAIQMASGMAGALIIEGGTDANGGLDAVPEIYAAEEQEKIFVLQQINFDQTGKIEDFKQATPDDFQRTVTVNGQFVPTIRMRPGEVQRWRFIHAGVSENIYLMLDGHLLHEIAADGIALGRMVPWPAKEDIGPEEMVRSILMGPGYRTDVLVQAGEPNEYFLRDERLPPALSLRASARAAKLTDSPLEDRSAAEIRGAEGPKQPNIKQSNIIARIVVEGIPVAMTLPKSDQLKDRVPTELTLIQASELNDKPQAVRFDAVTKRTCTPEGDCSQTCTGGRCPTYFQKRYTVNGRVYGGQRPDRVLAFGRASEWTLSGDGGFNHPFHIHVNPFQFYREEPDENGFKKKDKEPIWKDTLSLPSDGSSITVRSRYKRFEGDFFLHCHILGHEDQGMMEWVRIELPK